jgi:hypothetical protein
MSLDLASLFIRSASSAILDLVMLFPSLCFPQVSGFAGQVEKFSNYVNLTGAFASHKTRLKSAESPEAKTKQWACFKPLQ